MKKRNKKMKAFALLWKGYPIEEIFGSTDERAPLFKTRKEAESEAEWRNQGSIGSESVIVELLFEVKRNG